MFSVQTVKTPLIPILRTFARQALAIIGLVSGILLLASCRPAPARLDVLFDAPRFTLTDESAQPFSSDSLAGKVWMANFIFTTCIDECPLYLSPKMRALQEQILAKGLDKEVELVSFTVDPGHDTPEVLKEYASRYGAQSGLWHFLTGSETVVHDLLQNGFKVGAAMKEVPATIPAATQESTPGPGGHDDRAATGDTLIHTTRFLLVDRQGKIRAAYDGESVEVDEMFSGVQQLVQER